MIDCEALVQLGTTYPPATWAEIHRAEAEVQHIFPPLYVELLRCSNGFEPMTERYGISLFPTNQLAEMNEAYSVSEFAPTLLFIGLDGGGRGIFLDRMSAVGAVYRCGMGNLDVSESTLIAPNLEAWIASGFDLKDPPRVVHPERIDVYLVRPPSDRVRGLFRLREALNLSVTPREFRGLLQQLPYRILHAVPYLPYIWMCAREQQQDDCLYACEVDHFDQPIPFQDGTKAETSNKPAAHFHTPPTPESSYSRLE